MKSFLRSFSSLGLIQEGFLSVTSKRKVNSLVKFAQDKSVVICPDMTITVD